MKGIVTTTIRLEVDDTELQMLYEGIRRVTPYADLSPDLWERSKTLQTQLRDLVQKLPRDDRWRRAALI